LRPGRARVHESGFALSSRDRFVFTLRALKALDAEGGFDVLWNDDSERQEVPELSRYFVFRNARLVVVNYGVKGGADAAICFGLRRLLDLGYDYLGLLENDIVLQEGWFERLISLFDLTAADGVMAGAFDVRQVLRTDYVNARLNESGLAHPRIAASAGLSESSRVSLCP
jgi:GT2 family glycosyltransferase